VFQLVKYPGISDSYYSWSFTVQSDYCHPSQIVYGRKRAANSLLVLIEELVKS